MVRTTTPSRPRHAVAGVAAGAAYLLLYHLGRTSGSTLEERQRPLPGDGLIQRPTFVTNHAGSLPAPPDHVWPWLTQMGWHRGGWYTPRWVDRLFFPDNWPSAEQLDPLLLRDLRPGDVIPDGPAGTAQFVVQQAEAPRVLVLRSRSHIPPSWDVRFGATLDWVWTFVLEPEGRGTRMLIRNRGRVQPWWLDLGYRALVTPADHVMTRGMFSGLGRRLNRPGARRVGGRWLGRPGGVARTVQAGQVSGSPTPHVSSARAARAWWPPPPA
jgi:hypothetical protein